MDKYFTDIHCHALFGVDDGAKSADEALKIISGAYEKGTRYICLTPHNLPRAMDDTLPGIPFIKESFKALCELASEKFPDLRLFLGNEIFYEFDCVDKLKSGDALTLNGSSYVLLEFDTETDFFSLKSAGDRILSSGYTPIFAHVERYRAINEKNASRLISDGILLQMNARSVTSFMNGLMPNSVKALLKAGLISFVASDAHDPVVRAANLSEAYNLVSKKLGTSYADRIFIYNPMRVLNDEYIRK